LARCLLYKWRDQLEPIEESDGSLLHNSRELAIRKEVSQLKRVLADKVVEVDFFQRCLAKSRGSTPAERKLWREGIYDQTGELMPMQGSMSVERMCQLAQVSRAGFYRSLREQTPVQEEMELRSAIQQIAIEHRRRYGYRRISAELRRRGLLANHKRVVRIMREDNLLAMQPRQFMVTTDSDHQLEVSVSTWPVA
jgi:putative transposase